MLNCTATSGRTARLNGATAMADFGARRAASYQVNDAKQVKKVLSTGGVVYILYADGTWRKKEKK